MTMDRKIVRIGDISIPGRTSGDVSCRVENNLEACSCIECSRVTMIPYHKLLTIEVPITDYTTCSQMIS